MNVLSALRVTIFAIAVGLVLGPNFASAEPGGGFPLFGGDDDFDLAGSGLALRGGDDGFPIFASEEGRSLASNNELKTCSLIDFDDWSVRSGFVPDTWFLTVSGKIPSISLRVTLMRVIYVRQPPHWEIQVVACTPPIVLPTAGAFSETISVTGFMGTKGIEVVGETRRETWDKP